MKDDSSLKDLRKTIRFDTETLNEIKAFKGTHRIKNDSKALRSLVADYKRLKKQETTQKPSTIPSEKPSEKRILQKALGLEYPQCYDMVAIEGEPMLRQCICPASSRPVALTRRNGIYIVDNPKICMRCKALGGRKIKEKKKEKPFKHTQYNGGTPRKREYVDRGRAEVYFPFRS